MHCRVHTWVWKRTTETYAYAPNLKNTYEQWNILESASMFTVYLTRWPSWKNNQRRNGVETYSLLPTDPIKCWCNTIFNDIYYPLTLCFLLLFAVHIQTCFFSLCFSHSHWHPIPSHLICMLFCSYSLSRIFFSFAPHPSITISVIRRSSNTRRK